MGKAHTGTFGGPGFGANMKHIVDNSGNVSWLIFTGADLLAKFKDTPPAEGEAYTFLTDGSLPVAHLPLVSGICKGELSASRFHLSVS